MAASSGILNAGCLLLCFLYVLIAAKYKLSEIKIIANKENPVRVYTAEELSFYDGSKPDEPLYMAVRGVVFDVTKGKDFYGKGAPYNSLTGKDASKAIAIMSMKKEDLIDDLTGLSDTELKSLDSIYTETYLPKYPVVGYTAKFALPHLHELHEQKQEL